MIITIHQPEHLPYFGFLDKVNKSDVFIILDDVQFKKNNFQNRNQILTENGTKWLTIPVEMKNIENKDINQRKIKDNWKSKYINQVTDAYKKYDFFEENISLVEDMLSVESEFLIDFNMHYIETLFKKLDIKTSILLSSTLEVNTFKTQRLYDICKILEADAYLAGQGAIEYLDSSIFSSDVQILQHSFSHPLYKQKNSENFTPYMSSLDLIMSMGTKKLKEYLDESKKNSM